MLINSGEEQGWEEPLIEERYGDAARTTLSLSFIQKQAKKASEKTNEIKQTKKTAENKQINIEFIRNNGDSKTSEIAEVLNLSQARTRAILKELVAEGKIAAGGGTKGKIYFLEPE